MKAFHGMLARRNECGHPRTYDPGLNEALGFTAEVMSASNQESDVALTSPPSSVDVAPCGAPLSLRELS
jgi:hypothetical protein